MSDSVNISGNRQGLQILLGVHGSGQKTDVSHYLDTDREVTLTQERERDAFQRSYSDLSMRLGNMSGKYYDFFLGQPAGTMWDAEVRVDTIDDRGAENRAIFSGVIGTQVGAYHADTISFDIIEEKAELTAYAREKLFWKIAQALPIRKQISDDWLAGPQNWSLTGMMKKLISEGAFGGLISDFTFKSVEFDTYFYTSPAKLDPSTTVNDLLGAYLKFFNCQAYIEPETNVLTVTKRGAILNDRRTDISDRLAAKGLKLSISDTQSFDLIQVPTAAVPKPEFEQAQASLLWGEPAAGGGAFQVACTYTVRLSDGTILESDFSDFIDVPRAATLGYAADVMILLKPRTNAQFWPYNGPITGVRIYQGFKDRQEWNLIYDGSGLYLMDSGDELLNLLISNDRLGMGLAVQWANNVLTEETNIGGTIPTMPPLGDSFPIGNKLGVVQYFEENDPAQIWQTIGSRWTYDHAGSPATRSLYLSIGESGELLVSTSQGDINANAMIYTPFPSLNFITQSDGNSSDSGMLETMKFFGMSNWYGYKDMIRWAKSYADLLIPKKMISCTVEGLNYMLGDSVMLNRAMMVEGLIGKYVVRRAAQRVFAEETDLEIVEA